MAMPGTVAHLRSARRGLLAATFLLLGTVFIYTPVWTAELVYEDRSAVVEPVLEQPYAPINWLRTRALTRASYVVDRERGPSDPTLIVRRLHVTNVLLHLLNGGLVALLAWQLTQQPRLTWLAAAIFLWHPLQTEAVSYVAGRTELLSTFGVLAACAWALSSWRWRGVGVLASLVVAVWSKESAACGVGLVWLLLVTYRTVPRRLSWLLGGATLAGVLGWATLSVLSREYRVYADIGHLEYAGLQALALLRYAALVLIPWRQTVDHSFELLPIWMRWNALGLLLCVVTAIGIATMLLVSLDQLTDRTRLVLLGLAWVGLSLVLRFVMRIPEVLNEHQLYLAMAGIALALAAALAWRPPPAPVPAISEELLPYA